MGDCFVPDRRPRTQEGSPAPRRARVVVHVCGDDGPASDPALGAPRLFYGVYEYFGACGSTGESRSATTLMSNVETRQPPISPSRPGRPGKKNADLPRRKKKSAFQGRPAAAPRPPRKNWSPREVAAAIADEVGRNNI